LLLLLYLGAVTNLRGCTVQIFIPAGSGSSSVFSEVFVSEEVDGVGERGVGCFAVHDCLSMYFVQRLYQHWALELQI
jgi:hypothetical protein